PAGSQGLDGEFPRSAGTPQGSGRIHVEGIALRVGGVSLPAHGPERTLETAPNTSVGSRAVERIRCLLQGPICMCETTAQPTVIQPCGQMITFSPELRVLQVTRQRPFERTIALPGPLQFQHDAVELTRVRRIHAIVELDDDGATAGRDGEC